MTLDPQDLPDAVGRILALRFATRVAIEGFERLSGGASRETFAFELHLEDGTARPLILQRERPGGMRSVTGMSVEAGLVRAAAAHGVPAPAVVVSQGDSVGGDIDLGGPWLITEHVAGETLPRRILRDEELEDARSRVVPQCAHALAAIHRIPPEEVPGLTRGDPVEQQRSMLDQLGQPHPALELGLRWLDRNRPPERPSTVVHGDFRNGNLVVGPDGLRAVLDWELAHIGDPMEDLGWLCVRAWRFGSDLPVGGFGTREVLATAYERAGGGTVDPAALHWWEVLGTLRWGVICIVQASAHLSGVSRSVELAAIGRRVCETEHDLLDMMRKRRRGRGRRKRSGAGSDDGGPGAPGRGPHDVPDLAGLVEAVREFVEADVAAATTGRVHFHARVAANVLSIVERELALGPAQAQAHAERLAGLGFADDAELGAAIRRGDLDERWDEVRVAVAASVADKLAVANPGYAGD